MVVDDGAAHKEHKPMRALCVAVVLDLRVRPTKHFFGENILAALSTQ